MMEAKIGKFWSTLRWCVLLHRPPYSFLIFLAWYSGKGVDTNQQHPSCANARLSVSARRRAPRYCGRVGLRGHLALTEPRPKSYPCRLLRASPPGVSSFAKIATPSPVAGPSSANSSPTMTPPQQHVRYLRPDRSSFQIYPWTYHHTHRRTAFNR